MQPVQVVKVQLVQLLKAIRQSWQTVGQIQSGLDSRYPALQTRQIPLESHDWQLSEQGRHKVLVAR